MQEFLDNIQKAELVGLPPLAILICLYWYHQIAVRGVRVTGLPAKAKKIPARAFGSLVL